MTTVQKNLEKTRPMVALSIAGLDPSSGAGLTADLKTFAAHGMYGVSCATALTVQSTRGVRRVLPVDEEVVTETLGCLADDVHIGGIKIGMLGTAGVARAVSGFVTRILKHGLSRRCMVLDSVLRSSSGAVLLDEEGVEVLRQELLASVGWITPNVDELGVLVGRVVTRATVPEAAQQLLAMAAEVGNAELRVVVTGGHLDAPDEYVTGPGVAGPGLAGPGVAGAQSGVWVPGQWVETTSTHGTGCAFSSALLCEAMRGQSDLDAVQAAKDYVAEAMRKAQVIGQGRGPMHHLYVFEETL